MRTPPTILTIAGSDSGGGAGIQADLKTIAILGGYGASVVTALTAQNGLGVTGVHAPPADFVAVQLEAVLSGYPVAAAKTGMLFSAAIIEALAVWLERAKAERPFPLVVDPVCHSQTGHRLLEDDALAALKEKLLPLADLVTPNKPEAEALSGLKIADADGVARAGRAILDMGAAAVLVKGGHFGAGAFACDDTGCSRTGLPGVRTDWLITPGAEPLAFSHPDVPTDNTHGTGCALSAALAVRLGMGDDLEGAVTRAQRFLNLGLAASYAPGRGHGSPNHAAPLSRAAAGRAVLEDLDNLAAFLETTPGMSALVPEVRMNAALALPWPRGIEHVAAYAGRVTADRRGRVQVVGPPRFGASSHMAKVVLAAHSLNPAVHAAANLRYNDRVLTALEAAGFTSAWFDRAEEPEDLKAREGSSLEWGTCAALSAAPDPLAVDCVCDKGEPGKEPMVRLLADDAAGLREKLARLLEAMA